MGLRGLLKEALKVPERLDPAGLPVHRELERLSADYEATKARLAEVGFTCEGSLIERYTTCNNANCRCSDPEQRHGPYWQLSWKQAGKTVSKLLSAEDAALYQEWIANRRRLFHGPERPRWPRHSQLKHNQTRDMNRPGYGGGSGVL